MKCINCKQCKQEIHDRGYYTEDDNNNVSYFCSDDCLNKTISNLDEEPLTQEFRICSECKEVMICGYFIDGGEAYYCSDECLEKNMTRKEFLDLYDNGEGDSFWTHLY